MKKQKQKPRTDDALGLVAAERRPSRRASSGRRVQKTFNEPSLTQQQFKQSVDVNNIVTHYAQTGIDPYESRKQRMRFGAATSQSFNEAMFQTAEVNSAFASLPAAERQSYSNDPSKWLDAIAAENLALSEIVEPDETEAPEADNPAPLDPQKSTEPPDLDIT